jgi:nitroreductase
VIVTDQTTRERLAELNEPAVRRYLAQVTAGQSPWNPLEPPAPTPEEIAATRVPASFTRPVLTAAVVIVVCVDLGVVAATDQDLDRIGVVAGASVYPLVWNLLLAARNEGFGGTITTMAVAEEPAVRELLGIPEQYAVAAVVPLGKPVKQPTRLRRRPVAELATWERFDGDPVTG